MLRRDYSLNEVNAKGFLQHYGLPTELIDFTWWHTIAMAFAAKDNTELGRICVMPVGQHVTPPPLADLSRHPWAHRAQMQQAVGVMMPSGCEDLKSPSARRRFNLTWIEFPISRKDCEFLRQKREELISLANDPSGSFLRHHIIEYVEAKGKFSPSLTEWILGRIPMTPRYYKVQHFEPAHVIVTSPSPSELAPFDEQLEKEFTRRYLSSAYADSSWDRMKNWEWPEEGAIVVDPKTFHGSSVAQEDGLSVG